MAVFSESVVRTEQLGGVTHLVMERPPANALGRPLVEGLEGALDEFLGSSSAKVLVISSAIPGFFAAGADLKYISTLDPDGFRAYRDALRSPMERLASCGRPSIAAIDGLAFGGGLELAMACTLRFATPGSRLGLPEVKLGLIPGAGGTQRLPQLIGVGRALKLMLSGADIDGAEALAIGLVDQLCANGAVVESALSYAARLARWPAPAMASILTSVRAAVLNPADGMRVEGEEIADLFAGGHADAGIAKFLSK
ncbi:MAG: enoyl-CoA hydratase/isomerase family protein [Solirubrobacteraceae bacterium]